MYYVAIKEYSGKFFIFNFFFVHYGSVLLRLYFTKIIFIVIIQVFPYIKSDNRLYR